MSERKAGWYWVKPPFGQWVAAKWNSEYVQEFSYWEMPGTEEGFGDDQLLEIGPRIPTPDENWKYVPEEWLKNLHSSIAGDCYMGNEWELSTIDAMLSAAPRPNGTPSHAAETTDNQESVK